MKYPRRLVNGRRRRWPYDTLAKGEVWAEEMTPRQSQSVRNGAYQHAERYGKQFAISRTTLSPTRVRLVLERVK
jgi:hypothetical protein